MTLRDDRMLIRLKVSSSQPGLGGADNKEDEV